jgi:putative endonuclease
VFAGRITQLALQFLDRLTPPATSSSVTSRHQIGQRGEQDAYFYLRRRGYTMVARNYRSPRHHGEIDLIGWDHDMLCFIEVKTRTTRDVKPAEAAVDREKCRALRKVVGDYLNSLPPRLYPKPPQWRFDVLTVYYIAGTRDHNSKSGSTGRHSPAPSFELFQNAALSA